MKKSNLINAIVEFLTEQVIIPFTNLTFYQTDTPFILRESEFPFRGPARSKLPLTGSISVALAVLLIVSVVSLWFWVPVAFAVEESCDSCGQQVSITGDFTHRKDDASVAIQDATGDTAAFREEINGKDFTVSISNLPEGKYTILVGEVETLLSNPGERLFEVTSGDVALATNFDIVATAGGRRKVCYITGVVEHEDDSLRGPLKVAFMAVKNNAKFNTFEVKDASGESVVAFNASDLAEPFSAAATRIPEINEPPIWRDPAQPLQKRADDLIRRMSLEEKVAQLQNDAPAIARLGLPAYNYWNEALHGVANNNIATVFPEPVGMASTWNPGLLYREGNVIGIEGRAKFNDYTSKHDGNSKWWTGLTFWTPNINIFRDPRWGRGQETYGEDPYLAGEIAVEFIKGIQGDNPNYMLAMACAKHYAVHSGPERSRHRFNAEPSERDLYETYLPQFERVVREAKVGGVMSAYNALDGVPCSASTFLLDDLLRKQWGFEGYVVSDCSAINNIWNKRAHHYVDTPEEAAAIAVKAGCNLCCGGDYNALVKAVQKGLISEREINQALYYTLWIRFRLGLFDPSEKVPYSKYTIRDNDTPEHRQVALEVARQSLVLLKNDGILPLDRSKIKRIAVIGPNGKSTSMLEGNYHGSASHPVSILNGIKQLAGTDIEVTFAQGSPVTTKPGTAAWSRQDNETNRPLSELKAEALSHAANADLIIYVGGITPAQEGEGFDRDSIELPEVQEKLVQALHATGKPMVMVNCSGSAMAIPWEDEHLPAILQVWYPGEEGGRAVAEVLFGEVNPSGHLPVTFYRATTDLPAFTDYSMNNRTYRYFSGKPLYAFGHGLSYTKFTFQDGRLDSEKISADGIAKVSFTIQNTGGLDGDEVAQVYFRHIKSSVPQAKLTLCGFIRVNVKAGQSNQVTVEVPASRLRYWDTEKKQYVVEPGDYEFLVGAASDDIRLTLPITITATATFAKLISEERAFEKLLAAVVPSERQYAWQRRHEVYAFVHFGVNTFTGREWGTGKESPTVFNPTTLDTRQWAKALKSAGMTMAILTVKHHDGFCLWPSRYTEQSVKNSPWKEGKGDVVREFVEAVRAEGMEVGIYLSPADLFQIESEAGYYGDGSNYADTVIPTDPASFKSEPTRTRETPAQGLGANVAFACKADSYNRYFLNQLYELLTEYGPVAEVWFDGATPKTRGGQKYSYAVWCELIRKLQPQAVIFNRGPDVRWAGNEAGMARETEWSVVGLDKPVAEFDWRDMTGRVLGDRATLARAAVLHWYPAEANVSILPGWFYHNDRNIKSADNLMYLYEKSVGHNATLIINVPPDKRGLFTDAEVEVLKAFGELRQTRYGNNLATGVTLTASSSLPDHPASAALDGEYETYWEAVQRGDADAPVMLEITLPRQITFKRVVLQEQIRRGQRVEAFTIEVQEPDGQWRKLAEATTIGYKRIISVPETSATNLRIRFVSYRIAPTLAEVELYY